LEDISSERAYLSLWSVSNFLRIQKGEFASDLINSIRNLDPPGRFLEYNAETKAYDFAPMFRVLNKTLQALRETRWGGPSEQNESAASEAVPDKPTSQSTPVCTRSRHTKRRTIVRNRGTLEIEKLSGDDATTLSDSSTNGPDSSAWPQSDDVYDPAVASKIKVHCRIAVYWPLDKTHYIGKVLDKQKYDVLVQYEEDNLVEWVDLTRHSFRVLDK
jgi:hypothetical protein